MKFAYADPPYLGCSHLYPEHPDAAKYDDPAAHGDLMTRMDAEYDGWALSLTSTSLSEILPLAPAGVRVGAWVKGWCSWKPGNRVAYAWEPVIWRSGRTRKERPYTSRDWVQCNVTTNRTTKGAKPDAFCRWLFDLLGLLPGDEFDDLFPGSGAVSSAWERFSIQTDLLALGGER